MSEPLRIGIVGARGIGRHHARWFARAGCDVRAVYATSEESARQAAAHLRDSFGFRGQAFHDWDAFVRHGEFEACSVCSPAECHWPHVRDLAAAGKHLLCEKPLVWNWSYSPLQIIEEATRLVEACAHHGVILGVNAQYPAAVPGWLELHRRLLGREPEYRAVRFVLETRGRPRSPHGAAEVWVDLGPHPLAVLDALAPGGVDWETLRHQDGPLEVTLEFDWVSGPRRIAVHIECRRSEAGPLRRQVGNQDLVVDYQACQIEEEYRTL
ncbi:MAG TPA: Gfo/Idh/MocA family oxidoreductase, partial [Armatimonadota bacterium]|nr:Gfo/Idh/MocA family oxidoreductase [Armatimonadota bacterium]